MKIKIVIIILAVACAGLAIAFFATKKHGEEQHVADVNSILELSNQVVDVTLKNEDLKQVNLTYSNDVVMSRQQAEQLSNSLAAATVTIASSRAAIASNENQITNLTTRINDLEVQNKALDERASELTNTIAKLDALIADTRSKLNASENNNAFLQQELQKQMAQRAEIEHKFNDLIELRQQVKKIKTDLFVARRLEFMKNDFTQKKGAQLLIERSVPVAPAPVTPNYGLNVEVSSDGSVRVIPPLGAPTNAPAH